MSILYILLVVLAIVAILYFARGAFAGRRGV